MMVAPARQAPVAYVDRLDARTVDSIDLLVLHCTELPELAEAREYAEVIHYEGSQTGNCGHFYIDRDGALWQYVPLERVAHHVAGENTRSVGIELVNRGRFPNWHDSGNQEPTEPYPAAQLDSLIALTGWLQRALPGLRFVAGHEDLDRRRIPASDDPALEVPRKVDPGPMFPWADYLAGIELERVDEDSLATRRAG
ncbi:MAG: N-acetylmuramoyl-L-alanine amidase [Pseudomonadota bacterium]